MSAVIQSGSESLPEVDRCFEAATWAAISPSLSVADPEKFKNVPVFDIDDTNSSRLSELLRREGYFHIPQLPWNLPLASMAQTIVQLTQIGLVPPFCFVFDQFWIMFSRLHRLLGRVLDPNYAMLPEFWAWHVDPKTQESGWTPHRDKNHQALYSDGRPMSVTVWLPLTDATPLNGCIYIVPAHLDPTYGTPRENDWKFLHQDIRAVPSPAGGLLVWNSAVLHWGSRSSPLAAGPRISIACEFQRGDVPPMNQPLLPPMTFLNLSQRLKMIAKQVLQYQHMYPLNTELKNLVEGILNTTSAS